MAESAPFIYDVSTRDFAERVINVSFERPVLVDFWAPWCGPCKTLGPLLERVVLSYNGKVALAKMNVDENREVAAQLGIKSIPTVKIFLNGAIADEFVGVLPENDIRAIIDALAVTDIEALLVYAAQLVEPEQLDEAKTVYMTILEEQADHSGAKIGLARILLRQGQDEAARNLLTSIADTDERYEEAQSLLGLFEFVTICERHGGLEQAKQTAESAPDDLEARYNLGCCYAAHNSYRQAFEAFLSIVKKDRRFDEGKAHKAMLTLFTVVGTQDELTGEFRKKLAMELF